MNLGFVIVAKEDCGPEILSAEGGDRHEMYQKLEEGLLSQIKMCETNQTHFKVTGDVASSNKFQQVSKFKTNWYFLIRLHYLMVIIISSDDGTHQKRSRCFALQFQAW
jgi:hypothetical protein